MAKEQYIHSLRYAVRLPVVLKYFGQLAAVFGVLSIVPFAVSIVTGAFGTAFAYAVIIALFIAGGMALSRTHATEGLQSNEALTVTALIFIVSPLAATFPMMQSGLGFLDALFETVSGITTTGLTTLQSVGDKPDSFLFARAWMQWVGGLGIAILTVVILIRPGIAAKKLAYTESESEDLVGGAHVHARRILAVYLTLTVLGIITLVLMRVGPLDAAAHVLAAVSTGGFSTKDASLDGFSYPIRIAITLISACGAVSLALYYRAFTSGWRELWHDVELRTLLFLCLAFSILLTVTASIGPDAIRLSEAAKVMPLMAFSAQTTTGFATGDISGYSPFVKLVLLLQMSVGGMVGSTAGGMKILRFLVLVRIIHFAVIRTALPPHAVAEPRLNGNRLLPEEVERAMIIAALFIILIVVSWLPFVALGHNPLDSLFEVVSAVGTVGLSTGICSADLHPALKGVLCFDMLMGRLEIFALLVVLYPGTWLGRKVQEGA